MKARFVGIWTGLGMLYLLIPDMLWAAGGEGASAIIVVADTRRVTGIVKYFSDLYNTNVWLYAVWTVLLTALMGSILGFLMDRIMERTGLDLKSRKIIEH